MNSQGISEQTIKTLDRAGELHEILSTVSTVPDPDQQWAWAQAQAQTFTQVGAAFADWQETDVTHQHDLLQKHPAWQQSVQDLFNLYEFLTQALPSSEPEIR